MERLETVARVAGVRGTRMPRLEDIHRRRSQLWLLSLLVGLAVPAVFLVLQIVPPEPQELFDLRAVRLGMGALLVALVAYVVERERSLRQLTWLLVDERLRSAALATRVDELDLLVRASRAMNASLELDAVLGIILTSATELLDASQGTISLIRPEVPDELEIAAASGLSPVERGERHRIGPELAGLVMQVADPSRADRWLTIPAPGGSSPSLAVPLVHRNELVGVLDLVVATPSFGDIQLRSLSLFAETAAAAISNARMHSDSEASVATLTELDRLKDEFLTLVTHELRTPLTSVIGLAQTIERGGDRLSTDKVAELAGLISRQGWRLDGLVDDLLRSTEVRRDALTLAPEPVDVGAVARGTVTSLQATSPEHVLTLDLPDEPVVRMLDGDAVHCILDNLVGNAVKYTPSGSVVEVSVDGSDPDRVVLVVDDDGPGIPEAEWERVFDKFRRGEGLANGGGLGLGLYLVRALAAAHHGRATVCRSSRGGSCFTVTLHSLSPRARVAASVAG